MDLVLFLYKWYNFENGGEYMKHTDYSKFYAKIFRILGNLTPLRVDCGQLCAGALWQGKKGRRCGKDFWLFWWPSLSLMLPK